LTDSTEPTTIDKPSRSSIQPQQLQSIGILFLAFVVIVVGLRFFYPIGVDWQYTFSELPLRLDDPFQVANGSFTNPPWVIALLPHAFLPLTWGNAVNFALTIMVLGILIWKYKGGWQALVMTFTSPVMLDLARTNNVDWIPALAFLIPPMWGLPLLAVKPQTLGAAALIWWKKEKFNPLMVVPLVVVIVLSFIIWGFWPARVGLLELAPNWNFAPFPFMIPLGMYMLWKAWQAEDEILAAAATPFLVPYFAPYSITPLLALVACKYRKIAFVVYIAWWVFLIVDYRRRQFAGGF